MKILVNLVLLLAVLFMVLTQAGNVLAVDLFMRVHEHLTAYIMGIFKDSL